MNESFVTVVGNVVSDPMQPSDQGSADRFASLRIASTTRRWDAEKRAFVDGSTNFVNVVAFNALAANVMTSVKKGHPVVVYGRLRVNQWETEKGEPRTSAEIDAFTIGHDLTRGQVEFTRPPRVQLDSNDRLADPAIQDSFHGGEDGAADGGEDGRRGRRRDGRVRYAGWRAGFVRPGVGRSGCRRAGRLRGGWARTGRVRAPRRGRRHRRLRRRGRLSRPAPARRRLGVALLGWIACLHARVHLHHDQGSQGARRQGHPRRRDDVVLPRRQDRRGRAQRRRQVDDPQDHGRAGPAVER